MAQIVRDWTQYLIPQENYVDEVDEFGNSFKTTDFVTIISENELDGKADNNRLSLTDFAVANGGYHNNEYLTHDWKRSGRYWLFPQKLAFSMFGSDAIDGTQMIIKSWHALKDDDLGLPIRIKIRLQINYNCR